jgi:ABC-type phosphate/phosphonate transport system ATPase subunit
MSENAVATADNAVQIRDLGFSFGELQIFRRLSLDIPRGKVVAILGGSGSGKSTLLKLIGGQLRPEAGSITVEGRNVHQLSSDELYKLRLEMGMMFQTSGLAKPLLAALLNSIMSASLRVNVILLFSSTSLPRVPQISKRFVPGDSPVEETKTPVPPFAHSR